MRGLNAPPRSIPAPQSFTAFAASNICASLSTEQGPAITAKLPPPKVVFAILTIVSFSQKVLDASLYGSVILFTSETNGKAAMLSASNFDVSPITATTVLSSPFTICALRPLSERREASDFSSSAVADFFSVIIIFLPPQSN